MFNRQRLIGQKKTICDTRGVALVTVLLFMLLVTIIAGAALSIMTKQARLAEHQIRRIRGFYATESAINKAYQSLRQVDTSAGAGAPGGGWANAGAGKWKWQWQPLPGSGFEWDADIPTPEIKLVTVYYDTTTKELTADVDYSP